MNKTLKKTFVTICLAVMLFYVKPAHANVLGDIIGGFKDFLSGLVCDHWAPFAAEDTEKYVDQQIPGAGKYAGAVVLEAAALFCGEGKAALPLAMFDYNGFLDDIRDIFREELQEAFNNDNVQDAYGEIKGAIDFLNTSYEGDPDSYGNIIEMARLQFHDALSKLELVEKELVKQNVTTKSIVLGPYIAGVGGLISCFQEKYWLVAQTNNLNEARLYFMETARPAIEEKIEILKAWVDVTRKYLRSSSKSKITKYCPDGYETIIVACGDNIRLREPPDGWCVDLVCKGNFVFECYKAYYDNAYIGSACVDEYGSQEQAKDAIDGMIDDYVTAITPTLLAIDLAIAALEESLNGDWMMINLPLSYFQSRYFLPSIPILTISSGVNYTTEQISQKMSLTSGWNMISLPVLPENPSLSILFPDALVVYGYEQGRGYVRIKGNEKLEVGKGYWILLNKGHTYTLTGEPIKEFAQPIQNGWYMVGSCSSSAGASTRNGKINVMYNYSPGLGYKRVLGSDNLQSGQGYWVNISDVVYGYSFLRLPLFEDTSVVGLKWL